MTGKNGTAIWTGLEPGTYVLEEVDPADGYSIIQSSETVYLADSGEQSVITIRFENMPDGILLIRKVCATNPSVTLPDAEFKITYADGTLIGDSNGIFRTDENGEIRIEGLGPRQKRHRHGGLRAAGLHHRYPEPDRADQGGQNGQLDLQKRSER